MVSLTELISAIVGTISGWFNLVLATYGDVAWSIPFVVVGFIFFLAYIGSKVLTLIFKWGTLFCFIATLIIVAGYFVGW